MNRKWGRGMIDLEENFSVLSLSQNLPTLHHPTAFNKGRVSINPRYLRDTRMKCQSSQDIFVLTHPCTCGIPQLIKAQVTIPGSK